MQTLYLIRGVPGSGKSSFANELLNYNLVDYVQEADSYFVDSSTSEYKFDPCLLGVAHLECKKGVMSALELGLSVAVSNTSTTEREVQVYKEIAEKYNARFVSLIVENRHEGKNVHNVPEEKIKQMKDRFSIKL